MVWRGRWAGGGGWQEMFYDLCSFFLKYVPSTYCRVLLLLSFGGPEAWATHIICLKIILQPVWVSLWCLFHNNCLWIFIKIQVGWDLEPTLGAPQLTEHSLSLGGPGRIRGGRVKHEARCKASQARDSEGDRMRPWKCISPQRELCDLASSQRESE